MHLGKRFTTNQSVVGRLGGACLVILMGWNFATYHEVEFCLLTGRCAMARRRDILCYLLHRTITRYIFDGVEDRRSNTLVNMQSGLQYHRQRSDSSLCSLLKKLIALLGTTFTERVVDSWLRLSEVPTTFSDESIVVW